MPRGKGIYEDESDSFEKRDPSKSAGDDEAGTETDTPDVESTEQAGEPTG
jgi:hypothetical protein